MHAEVRLTIEGDKRLQRELNGMRRAARNQVMRPAIREGLTPILQEARRRTPWMSLRKLLAKEVKTSRKGKGVWGRVYFREHGTRTITVDDGRVVDFNTVASIFEFGTKDGRILPRGMLRGAREAKTGEALRVVRRRADQELQKQWRRRI